MSSFTVTGLISKLEHRDRDFRYMASSDLLAELQKESFKPDSDGEKKLCRSILKLLHDQSSDVQGLAVKCLSPLVRKVHGQLVEEIMVELVKDVLTGKEDQRDICSIGLKTVVLEMPQTMALSAVRHLAPKLVEGLSSQTLEVKLECMDILNDTLKRFGSQLKEDESDRCLGALFVELGSPRPASRKARRARNLPLLRAPLITLRGATHLTPSARADGLFATVRGPNRGPLSTRATRCPGLRSSDGRRDGAWHWRSAALEAWPRHRCAPAHAALRHRPCADAPPPRPAAAVRWSLGA